MEAQTFRNKGTQGMESFVFVFVMVIHGKRASFSGHFLVLIKHPYNKALEFNNVLLKLPRPTSSLSLPSWTRRPHLITGEPLPDLVRHHRLALSSLPIPVMPPFLFLNKQQSTFSTSSMERGNLGSLSKSTAVPSLPNLFQHSLRRKKLTAFLSLTRERVIPYRPSLSRSVNSAKTQFFQVNLFVLQVTGRIITGSNIDDSFAFLNYMQPIWAKSPDSSRLSSPSDGVLSNKLLGHCVWPLSIPIPRTVNAPTGTGDTRSFCLPETFLERHTKVGIQYDLTITISRGKLRADNK